MENTNNADLIKNNLLGIKDEKALLKAEYTVSMNNIKALKIKPIKGDFDFKHLKKIHKAIFKGVYKWAGKDRSEMKLQGSMIKEGEQGPMMFCQGAYIPNEANRMFTKLAKENHFKDTKSINEFASKAADFLGDLYALHPFREGNSRTQRMFVNDLAKNAGWKLDLDKIPEKKMKEMMEHALNGETLKLEMGIRANMKQFKQTKSQSKGISR